MERDELQKKILAYYAAEHDALGEAGTLALLERGRAWRLGSTSAPGGVVVAPHSGGAVCGRPYEERERLLCLLGIGDDLPNPLEQHFE